MSKTEATTGKRATIYLPDAELAARGMAWARKAGIGLGVILQERLAELMAGEATASAPTAERAADRRSVDRRAQEILDKAVAADGQYVHLTITADAAELKVRTLKGVLDLAAELQDRDLMRRVRQRWLAMAGLDYGETARVQYGFFDQPADAGAEAARMLVTDAPLQKGSLTVIQIQSPRADRVNLVERNFGLPGEAELFEQARSGRGVILLAGATDAGLSATLRNLLRLREEAERETGKARKKVILSRTPGVSAGIAGYEIPIHAPGGDAQRAACRMDPDDLVIWEMGEEADFDCLATVAHDMPAVTFMGTIHAAGAIQAIAKLNLHMRDLGENWSEERPLTIVGMKRIMTEQGIPQIVSEVLRFTDPSVFDTIQTMIRNKNINNFSFGHFTGFRSFAQNAAHLVSTGQITRATVEYHFGAQSKKATS